MWNRELAERYNTIRQEVVTRREACERLIAEGQAQDSETYQTEYRAAERGIADMERVAQQAEGLNQIANIPAAIAASEWEDDDQARPISPAALAAVQRPIAPWFEGVMTGDGLPPARMWQEVGAAEDYALAFEAYTRRLSVKGASQHWYGARNVLQVGVDPYGGLLVPPDKLAGVLARMAAAAPFTEQVGLRTTSRDRVQITTVRPAASDYDVYSSNMIGAWVSEIPGSTAGETEPTLGLLEIPVRKARTKTFLTHEELADPDMDVIDMLTDLGGENLGLLAEKGFIVGTGRGQPRGIFAGPAGANPAKGAVTAGTADQTPLVCVEGSTANTISSSTSDQASVAAIIGIPYRLPSQYLTGARWLMHRLSEASIRKLIDGAGSYIWAPGFAGMPNELSGFPITRSDWCAVEADAAKVLAFGNFKVAYKKVQRMLLTTQIDPYSKTDVEQVVLYLRIRLGGDIINPRAFVIGAIATS